MRMKKFMETAFILIAALSAAHPDASALSRDRKLSDILEEKGLFGDFLSEKIDISIPARRGAAVEVEHSFGDINVVQGDDSAVRISGEKRVTAKNDKIGKEFLDGMSVVVDERGGRIFVTTAYPDSDDRPFKNAVKSFSISYTLEIPRDTELMMENSFGDVSLTTLTGAFSVTNGYGSVTAADITGDTELNNKFGSIRAERVNGDAVLSNQHGGVEAVTVEGDLFAKTSHSGIKAKFIRGGAELANSHGKIDVSNVGGNAVLTTSFGAVDCRTVTGSAKITNSHGRITVSDIRRDAELTTSFASVRAEKIGGDATIVNRHGSVDLDGVAGDADVETSHASLTLNDIGGSLSAVNQHGGITAGNILPVTSGSRRQVRVKTSYGTIRLGLPSGTSARIKSLNTFGKFKSDFQVMADLGKLDLSGSSRKIEGTVGGGRDTIDIEGSHSNIYLEKM